MVFQKYYKLYTQLFTTKILLNEFFPRQKMIHVFCRQHEPNIFGHIFGTQTRLTGSFFFNCTISLMDTNPVWMLHDIQITATQRPQWRDVIRGASYKQTCVLISCRNGNKRVTRLVCGLYSCMLLFGIEIACIRSLKAK